MPEMIVNDRRRVTPETMATRLEELRATDPEKTYQIVVGAVNDYVRARATQRKDQDGKEWSTGLTIPAPGHPAVDELARYVVEAVLKSGDGRKWIMLTASDLRTGDVFTRYAIVDQKEPQDFEVTVLSTNQQSGGRARVKIKCRDPKGNHLELVAAPDYLFYVHRPDTRDVLRELIAGDEVSP
jgi:hypothetical protein